MSVFQGRQKHLRDYERISANGGGRSVAGKVQFYARDLTGISASQPLLAGKVSPLKLDLTRNLQRLRISNLAFIEGLLRIQYLIDDSDRLSSSV